MVEMDRMVKEMQVKAIFTLGEMEVEMGQGEIQMTQMEMEFQMMQPHSTSFMTCNETLQRQLKEE